MFRLLPFSFRLPLRLPLPFSFLKGGKYGQGGLQSKKCTLSATWPADLAQLLEAGLPLPSALHALATAEGTQRAASIWQQVAQGIQGGARLSTLMAQHPRTFPALLTGAVGAGEAAGNLPGVLKVAASYQANTQQLKRSSRAAFIYPVFVAVAAVAVLVLFVQYVLPTFEGLLASLPASEGGSAGSASWPWLTQALLGIAHILAQWGVYLALGAAALVLVFVRWVRTPAGSQYFGMFLLKLPGIGHLRRMQLQALLWQTLHVLLNAGMPLVPALKQCASSVPVYAPVLESILADLNRGVPFSAALNKHSPRTFPALCTARCRIAEETGNMPAAASTLAEYYTQRAKQSVANLLAWAEPVLTIGIAALVAVVIIALFLPLVTLVQGLQ